jgi:predicted MFS family arabinose efflux permease
MFVIGTDNFVFAGILNPVAKDLNVSASAAGQLVTVFSLAFALFSPVLATATAGWSRNQVLLCALALFSLGNVATALAPSYPLVLLARILAASGAAMYTPNAAASAAMLVPVAQRGRALSVVSGGLAVAAIAGVPAGTWLAGQSSWRSVLWALVAASVVVAATAALVLPRLPVGPPIGLRQRLRPLADPRVLAVLAVTFLIFLGAFSVYTYIGAVLGPVTHGHGSRLAWLLVIYGVAGAVGTWLAGRATDRIGPVPVLLAGLAGLTADLLLLPVSRTSYLGAVLALVVWGIAGWSVTVPQQTRLLASAPEYGPLLMSLNSAALTLGVAGAAALGGLGLDVLDASKVCLVGGAVTGLALLVAVVTSRRGARPPLPAPAAPAAERVAAGGVD